MSNTELLPCPFCGGPAELEEVDGGGWSVGCEEKPLSVHYCMGYQSLTSFATKREAISAWNTRTQLDELRAENERLKNACVALEARLDAERQQRMNWQDRALLGDDKALGGTNAT